MNGNVLLKTDGIRLGGSARYVRIPAYINKLRTNRTGYDVLFGERSKYLDVFYNQIKNKNKILLKKNIILVEQYDTSITVRCDDGTSYRADILAGADGVRSTIRGEMWRLASEDVPNLLEHDKQGNSNPIEPLGTVFDCF
jgi:2-polyprenyl-6-methoxyphenol hydroxylase-like FAD-dependent oxidoreductase